jgi:hypothetical protein
VTSSHVRKAAMSFKRLILLLIVIGALAAVLVGLAAGGGGGGKRQPKSTPRNAVLPTAAGKQQGSVKQSRPSKSSDAEKYWTPDRMKNAKPLPIGIPGGKQRGGSGQGGGSTAPAHP